MYKRGIAIRKERTVSMHAYKEEQKTAPSLTEEFPAEEESEETSIEKDENGTYRWTYEMELLHNHAFLLFLMRLILVPSAVVFVVILAFSFKNGTKFKTVLMAYGILVAVLAGVVVIIWFAHLFTARIFDNRFILHYEMNDKEIALVQGEERSVSEFRTVRTVRIDRENRQILLNSWFLYNMICCEEKDFDFVADYIVSRCRKAWIFGR